MLCVIFCRVNVERGSPLRFERYFVLESPLYSAFFVRARCCTGE